MLHTRHIQTHSHCIPPHTKTGRRKLVCASCPCRHRNAHRHIYTYTDRGMKLARPCAHTHTHTHTHTHAHTHTHTHTQGGGFNSAQSYCHAYTLVSLNFSLSFTLSVFPSLGMCDVRVYVRVCCYFARSLDLSFVQL